MEDSEYVTVVSVDNGAENVKTDSHSNSKQMNFELNRESQFVTVLSINDDINRKSHRPEEVIVYRLPGERLGFGLKFQGGSKSTENIQRLFIQSCATDTPASRAKTSWGHLSEGDEILEIDGIDVKTMTRLECVRYLKESNLAIKLNVRNMRDVEDKTKEFVEIKEKSHVLPPTPSAPPRKINKRKPVKIEHEIRDDINEKPLTPPPDAEYYVNLFSEENENLKFRDYESDDTASTISTVVDNFSIHSNSDLSLSSFNTKQPEITKALKSFTTLEKEFSVDNRQKSDELITHIKPPTVFQDECNSKLTANKKEIQFQSIEIKRDCKNGDTMKTSDYENIDLASKATKRNYENVEFNRAVIHPTPLPRRGITENNKIIIPKVRLTGSDDTDGVHECNINTDDSSKEDDKENELPKLIKCVPKMSLADKFKLNVSENEKIAAVVKQCIKIDKVNHEICSSSEEDDVESSNNLMSDDDSDKLGPPEFVDGPGPSEVYFNYHWNNNALPTIGEVEEEFSSLDMNKGPIVIINKVEEPVTSNAESTKDINQSITMPPKQSQMTSTNSHPADKSTNGKTSNNTNENVKSKIFAKSEVNVEVSDYASGTKSTQHRDKVQSKITSTVKTINKLTTNEPVEHQSGSQHTESIKNNSKIPIKFNSNNNHKSVITVEKSNKINSNLSSVDHNETLLLSERNGSTPNIVIVKNVKENLDRRNSERNTEQSKCELIEPSVSEPKINCNNTSGTVIAERIILGTESSSAKQATIGHQSKMEKIKTEVKIGGMDRDNLTTSKPMIANDVHVHPPSFSRLPPDGHEFPPNFSEPIIITSVFKQNADIKLSGDRSSPVDVAPSPPKSNPPQTLPRKIYRQDLVITVDDARFDQSSNFIPIATTKNSHATSEQQKSSFKIADVNQKDVSPAASLARKNFNETNKAKAPKTQQSEDTPVKAPITSRKQYAPTAPSNWRKDEKSEKSVRDKIAMFSSDKTKSVERKVLNKSTDNLLLDNSDRSLKSTEIEGSTFATLTKKAQSVDTLDTIDSSSENHYKVNFTESTCDSNSSSKKFESGPISNVYPYNLRAYSVENLRDVESMSLQTTPLTTKQPTIISQTPSIPTSYASLPRSKPPTITRTTSFSGSREHQNYDERRRTSISNLLEQRKKSMSKLRGLIIPEKTALASETEQVLDLPEIKSADTQKVILVHSTQQNSYSRREPVVPNPRHYTSSYQSLSNTQDNGYVSIFGSGTNRAAPKNGRSSDTKTVFPKPVAVVTPPTKPPRTSLIIASQQTTTKESNKFDDSDNDSVFCAKMSSPPNSPVTNPPIEKIALTRTLSSETNTSIASSTTSTLTSGSGSQASCSSVGSTPTIDMSRKIVRSTSKESYVNRKMEKMTRIGRYEDEDSTDGCEDDIVRHIPKSKQRSAQFGHNKVVPPSLDSITNYRLASNENAVVDMIVKVAEFVEVTSDSNSDSNTCDSSAAQVIDKFMNEERKASFKAVQEAKIVKTVPKVSVPTVQTKQTENNNDLAKWVRSEVAKTRKLEETRNKPEPPKVPARNSVLDNIKKFNGAGDKPIAFTPTPLNLAKKTQIADNRKGSESTRMPPPLKSPKNKLNNHERFSSLDSLASSSSGVSSTLLTNTPEHGSLSSFESNHSLITPADLQLIIEEADPPLKTPEAVVVVLYRDSPECSVGVTLAGGADYETKEITIHRILSNSPAYKDGRLRKGDRILSINGLSMRGLTHRESVTVLKSPRTEVVMVVTRSESVKISNDLGSLNSLCDKPYSHLDGNRRRTYHKVSKSLDLDVDGVSNEGSIFDDCKSLDDRGSTISIDNISYGATDRCTKNNGIHNEDAVKIVEVMKDSCGLGLAIEGGLDSPTGHRPLTVKKVFMGGAAEKAGNINVGDVILSINDFCTKDITRVQAWNYMKGLPSGPVKFVLS
ncbi:hypothetical protein HA402_007069 [Bradysia odoriphaga]|nr:hypothetical protein HA402_007069 [Bradysia odoriphaga]